MDYKDSLETQIREQYGKVVYTYACHWEEIGILSFVGKCIKNGEIALTAISTTGIVGYLITDFKIAIAVGAVFSALALALTLYARENNIDEKIVKHQKSADELWLVREHYLSLLTDFHEVENLEIKTQRDILTEQLSKIYSEALPTSRRAYKKAQKSIKEKEYQYFSKEELNNMLPEHLRKIDSTCGES